MCAYNWGKTTPFLRTYKVDYVNLSRDTTSTSTVSTQISSASGGGASSSSSGGNTSTTDVSTESTHHFWSRLVSNISAILGEETSAAAGGEILVTSTVIPNPESGVLSVRATAQQHEQIQSFIDQVLVSAKRQVLIQTTIVEVTLSERYQAGINWNALSSGLLNIASATSGGLPGFATAAGSSFVINNVENINNDVGAANADPAVNADNITATVTLLDEFGDTKILSSPQMMVLNNQTALLKVVENLVYFEVDAEVTANPVAGGNPITSVDTTALTVPVGIVMSVTPQIDSNGSITLVVRPTISRFVKGVTDPNPNATFTPAGGTTVTNQIPQIAVREMESVLRMTDGQIGVLGGLMEDEVKDNDAGLPGVKNLDFFGRLFKSTSAEYTKKELVIFIKPIIINSPDIESDLEEYKKYISDGYRPLSNKIDQGDDNL